MKCGKCGFDFYEGLFCPECGTKYNEQESQLKEKEEQLKREEEIAKAKAEQERLEKERIEHEAELLKQKNENLRLKEEAKEKERIAELERKEVLSRTFNDVVYDTIEEKIEAERIYEEKLKQRQAINDANNAAIWCFFLSISTFLLTITAIGWIPALYKSVDLGIKALKGNTERKGLVQVGFIIDILFVIALIYAILQGLGYIPEP